MRLVNEARLVASEARGIATLMGDAVEQLGKLLQNEVELAKAEMSEKVSQAGKGIAFLIGAGILIIPVLVVLLITLALWLQSFGLSPVIAHLAAAAAGALCSLVLAVIGKRHLEPEK